MYLFRYLFMGVFRPFVISVAGAGSRFGTLGSDVRARGRRARGSEPKVTRFQPEASQL